MRLSFSIRLKRPDSRDLLAISLSPSVMKYEPIEYQSLTCMRIQEELGIDNQLRELFMLSVCRREYAVERIFHRSAALGMKHSIPIFSQMRQQIGVGIQEVGERCVEEVGIPDNQSLVCLQFFRKEGTNRPPKGCS